MKYNQKDLPMKGNESSEDYEKILRDFLGLEDKSLSTADEPENTTELDNEKTQEKEKAELARNEAAQNEEEAAKKNAKKAEAAQEAINKAINIDDLNKALKGEDVQHLDKIKLPKSIVDFSDLNLDNISGKTIVMPSDVDVSSLKPETFKDNTLDLSEIPKEELEERISKIFTKKTWGKIPVKYKTRDLPKVGKIGLFYSGEITNLITNLPS